MRSSSRRSPSPLSLHRPRSAGRAGGADRSRRPHRGQAETLFEGPILTDGHNVRATPTRRRRRDAAAAATGSNNAQNPSPGPTPTAASVDAMAHHRRGLRRPAGTRNRSRTTSSSAGGPTRQDEAEAEYWGILVNNVFTNVGGCQYQLDGGDEVLWVYDAFSGRERLALYPAGYTGGAAPLTATATLSQPFELEVDSWEGYNEGGPPAAPTRSTTPYEGAEVAPVVTNAQGFEKVDAAAPETVTTGADGRASITFDAAGWHRIKATDVDSAGKRRDPLQPPRRLRAAPPASGCGPPPPDDLVADPAAGAGERRRGGSSRRRRRRPQGEPRSSMPPARRDRRLSPGQRRRAAAVRLQRSPPRPRPPRRWPGRGELAGPRPRPRGREVDDLLAAARCATAPATSTGRAAATARRRPCASPPAPPTGCA